MFSENAGMNLFWFGWGAAFAEIARLLLTGWTARRSLARDLARNLAEGEKASPPAPGDQAQYVVCMNEREFERYNKWLEERDGNA